MDKRIVKDEFLSETSSISSVYVHQEEKDRLLKYLNDGERILSLTLALFEEGDYIGPYVLFTDGEWVWPSHFIYFLERNDFKDLGIDFFESLKLKNFVMKPLSSEDKQKVSVFVEQELLNVKTRS